MTTTTRKIASISPCCDGEEWRQMITDVAANGSGAIVAEEKVRSDFRVQFDSKGNRIGELGSRHHHFYRNPKRMHDFCKGKSSSFLLTKNV
ncbi:hypothetical protein DY000_02035085 [Brassica cretica]|uniref:Uncharacterized protein n=1 Tax=Brassica cretica TaxID=69181 RepID=A0ABQ7DWD0_BRACR|nr:hypothetical protein DY000_02035085 [Brassica cretica]